MLHTPQLSLDLGLGVGCDASRNRSYTVGRYVSWSKYCRWSKVRGTCRANHKSSLCRSRTLGMGPDLEFRVPLLASSRGQRFHVLTFACRSITSVTFRSFISISIRQYRTWFYVVADAFPCITLLSLQLQKTLGRRGLSSSPTFNFTPFPSPIST